MADHGVAILGAGIFAKSAHLPALALTPSLTLKAVYSRSATAVASLLAAALEHPTFAASAPTAYSSDSASDLAALLARPDVRTVILSLPILVQPAIIEQAWAAGKNVISEKPVAKDLDEARRLIELYEAEYKPKGLVWIVAEQFPYLPAFVKAAELIRKGKVGELRTFSMQFTAFVAPGSKYVETPWRKVPEYQGGFLLDGGVHQFAGLRHVLPSSLAALTASRQLLQPHLAPFDTLQGMLKTADGTIGSFFLSFGIECGGPKEVVVRGAKGSLVVDFAGPTHTVCFTPTRVAGEDEGRVEEWEMEANGVEAEFSAFAAALVAGPGSTEANIVEQRSGPRAALSDLECIQRALESGESGRWVALA